MGSKVLRAGLVAALGCSLSLGMRAQGCSQCRDTVSQTNPAQQQSYREAIEIMLAGVTCIGGAAVFVARRFGR